MGTMPRYGSYDPMAQDPVLQERRARFEAARNDVGRREVFPWMRPSAERDIGLPVAGAEDPAAALEAAAQRASQPAPASTSTGLEERAARLAASTPRSPIEEAVERQRTPDPARSASILAGGDFRASSPDWGVDVSAAGFGRDDALRAAISRRHVGRLQDIQAEDAYRPDAMEDMTRGRARALTYERTLPMDATSSVRAWQRNPQGQMGIVDSDAIGERPLGGYTMGEEQDSEMALRMAAARANPKDRAEGALGMGRGRLVEELDLLRSNLEDDIRSGRRTPEDANAMWQENLQRVQSMVDMLKGGFPQGDRFTGL